MISVIIPVYNEEKDILECLESLDSQRGVKFEVLIVDDGSTDKTKKIIKKFKPTNYKINLINQNHKGAGMARNKGAIKAKGNILIFVDADMTFDSYFLKKLTTPIIKGHTKGTNSHEEFVSNWDNVWARCWNYNENRAGKKRNGGTSEHKVFRAILKSEFNKVGGFSKGGYTDDWSLSQKLGYKPTNAKGAIFYHKNPSSLSEIFNHAKWVGKREYKLGIIGAFVALVRSTFPISILVGVIKAVKHKELRFIIFKVVYDFGNAWGVTIYSLLRKGQK